MYDRYIRCLDNIVKYDIVRALDNARDPIAMNTLARDMVEYGQSINLTYSVLGRFTEVYMNYKDSVIHAVYVYVSDGDPMGIGIVDPDDVIRYKVRYKTFSWKEFTDWYNKKHNIVANIDINIDIVEAIDDMESRFEGIL